MAIKRRDVVKGSVLGTAAVLAAPAVHAQAPQIRWRMASSFPKSLDTVFGAADVIARRVGEATDGRFQISVAGPGEIVPALQVLDAVGSGTIECGHSAGFYYFGKDSALIFDTGVPFGMTPRQQSAWHHYGSGRDLMAEIYQRFGVIAIPAGNTGAQMGGWYRKEIKTPEDFKGLKMRVAGFAGVVMARLGIVPQQLPGGEIYAALEKGTLDAVEWVGPYDDDKLGFQKVAKFYYAPGILEPGASTALMIHAKAWEALPKPYQAILRMACAEAEADMLAKYDSRNAVALKRLTAAGAQLRYYPRPVVQAMWKATQDAMREEAAKNAQFGKLHDSYFEFLAQQTLWYSVNDSNAERAIAAARGDKT